jgi:hypothetical protein
MTSSGTPVNTNNTENPMDIKGLNGINCPQPVYRNGLRLVIRP